MMFVPRENWDGYWQVSMTEIPFLDQGMTKGSYNVLNARLLGLSYCDYLKYCRAQHNGTIRKSSGYPYCVFKDKKNCNDVCNLLNKEWGKIEKFFKENEK